jgi:hypothetical protein
LEPPGGHPFLPSLQGRRGEHRHRSCHAAVREIIAVRAKRNQGMALQPQPMAMLYSASGKQDTTVDIFLQGLYEVLNRNINLPVDPGKMDKSVFNKFIAESHFRGKHFIFFFDEIDQAVDPGK